MNARVYEHFENNSENNIRRNYNSPPTSFIRIPLTKQALRECWIKKLRFIVRSTYLKFKPFKMKVIAVEGTLQIYSNWTRIHHNIGSAQASFWLELGLSCCSTWLSVLTALTWSTSIHLSSVKEGCIWFLS